MVARMTAFLAAGGFGGSVDAGAGEVNNRVVCPLARRLAAPLRVDLAAVCGLAAEVPAKCSILPLVPPLGMPPRLSVPPSKRASSVQACLQTGLRSHDCSGNLGNLAARKGCGKNWYQLYHSSVTHIHSYVHKTKATPWGVAITFLGLPDVYLAIQSIHPSTSDRSGCKNDVILTQGPCGSGFCYSGARGPPGMRAIATRAPSQAITD